MKSLLLLLAMLGTAYADSWPTEGPCADVEACEKACAKNTKGTCYWGGVLVLQTVKENRYERAEKLFERPCARGDGEACFQVARMIANREWETDKKSGPKSLAAYKRACDKNHARACGDYAYYLGEAGDEKSKKLAVAAYQKKVKLLERRCTKEKMYRACYMLSGMYGYGEGVAKDEAKAKKWADAGEKLMPKPEE